MSRLLKDLYCRSQPGSCRYDLVIGLSGILLCISCLTGFSQKFNYAVSAIPDSLLQNSKSVVREHTMEFELKALNTCKIHETKAITVLDRGGDGHVVTGFHYSNDLRIDKIEVLIYDKNGLLIKKFKRKDLSDISHDLYGTLYSDYRVLLMRPKATEYPYTIKYNVKYMSNNSYSIRNWAPVSKYNQSIQHSVYKITVPEGYKLHYKQTNIPSEVLPSYGEKTITYTWEIHNFPSVKEEAFISPEPVNIPRVLLSPSDFQYAGYTGNMKGWKEFGYFIHKLFEGRDQISPGLKKKIQEMTEEFDDPKKKVEVVYKYLQNTTRYVSIQVGIGGLQTFPASTVEKFGYGDCKALSNYMKSLLKAIDIDAHCALVEAGQGRYYYDTSFVHDPFNHVILYVPLDGEEIWLECSSQIIPFGFLGDFTDNRYALVFYEKGGFLKKTTSYFDGNSHLDRNVAIHLFTDKNAKAIVTSKYTGLYYDEIIGLIHSEYNLQRQFLYNKHIKIPDYKINSFEYREQPSAFPSATELLDLELINYSSVSGSRMFVPLNSMNRFGFIPKSEKGRINPIYINQEISEFDSVSFVLPEGYRIEHLPDSESVATQFGRISVFVTKEHGVVTYCRTLTLYRKEHSRESYEDFIAFCKSVNRLDNQKMVLVRD